MIQALLWYLAMTLLGGITFPLSFSFLRSLKDRGYAFSRILGLLIWGYLFWIFTNLGISHNTIGGITFALLLLLALSLWLVRLSGIAPFKSWWQENRSTVIVVEILFAVSFALMTIIRAANPDALGTEKPMELAFINAILRSPTFPPHDPWLSGYAISYYHFGYILVAMLAKLTGTSGSVAFNLGSALVFSLSAIAAYGLLADLLAARYKKTTLALPLLAPLMTILMGNWEGFLEILHAKGLFWQNLNGQLTSSFWKWLDLVELSQPPQQPFQWLPSRWYWWWRASRVLQDYDVAGGFREIIDEFPAFSYVLADLHPHVLAMPFAFLAMALALNLLHSPPAEQNPPGALLHLGKFTLPYPLNIPLTHSLLYALLLGGLAFLNTWDFPIYVALCAGAYALWKHNHPPLQENPAILSLQNRVPLPPPLRQLFVDFLLFGVWCGFLGGVLYIPFYVSFASQAGGILPNLVYPTRGVHLWIMFAPLWLPLFAWLFQKLPAARGELRRAVSLSLGFMLALWLLSLALGVGISLIPKIGELFLGSIAAGSISSWMAVALQRRLLYFFAWLTLTVLLAACLALLFKSLSSPHSPADRRSPLSPQSPSLPVHNHFILLLILGGVLLVIIPEFFFLRDQFGWRMNTVFKFYYQAWLLWGIASAYALSNLILSAKSAWKITSLSISYLGIALGLVYFFLAVFTVTNNFRPPNGFTLDSSAYLWRQNPDEMSAIRWLNQAPLGTVAEAVSPTGGSYTQYARVATHSGQPAVLGWTGHESQWRGGAREMGSRQADIERLYCTRDWLDALQVLQQYNIRYVFLADLERNTYKPGSGNCPYGLVETKFQKNLIPIFRQGNTVVYYVP